MARKVQVLLVDDLDGSDLGENGETVAFGVGGERYEIDLSHENAEKFRDYMGRYVSAARNVTRVGGTKRSSSVGAGSRRSSSDRDETKAARAWLVEHGYLSADSRGRISQDNWERYRQRGQMSTAAAEWKAGDEVPISKPTEPLKNGQDRVKAAASGTAEASSKPDKAPRGNSSKAEKASAGTSGTPDTKGVASLIP